MTELLAMATGVSESNGDSQRTEEFLRLFAANQPRIFAYILTMLPDWNDAEEVLQATCVTLWQSFAAYESGTNFNRWACKVALHQVLTFRKRRKRGPTPFGDRFVEVVSQEIDAQRDSLDDQRLALTRCIKKLHARDRDLVNRCYASGAVIKEVARQLDRPPGTVYKALTRIRRALFACIEQTLATEGRA